MYLCPKCKSKNIEIEVKVQVKLIQHGEDDFETDYEGGNHEWSGESIMTCMACATSATVDEFEVKEEDEDAGEEAGEASDER